MQTYEEAIRVFGEFRQEFMEALPGFDDPQCCKDVALDMLDCLGVVLQANRSED